MGPGRPIAVIVIVSIAAFVPMLVAGLANGDNIVFNLAWEQAFSKQLFAGEGYPRWLSDLNCGAGSAVFYFYAPLPFYVLAAVRGVLPGDVAGTTVLGVGQWVLLLASGLALFALAKRRTSAWPAAIAACLYMLLPYHYEYDLWRRQAIGEFAAFAVMPIIVLFATSESMHRRAIAGLAVSYGLLVFCHLPTALLFSIALGAILLLRASRHRSVHVLVGQGAGIGLGLMLAAIYLVPALLTQEFVSIERLWNAYHTYETWLLFDGKSAPNALFEAGLARNLISCTAAVVMCAVGASRGSWRRAVAELAPWLLVTAMAVVLTTGLSTPIWAAAKTLQKVQFPWRFFAILDLAVAMSFAVALHALLQTRAKLAIAGCIGAAIAIAIGMSGYRQMGVRHESRRHPNEIATRDRDVAGGFCCTYEYVPRGFKHDIFAYRPTLAKLPRVHVEKGDAKVEIDTWQPRHIRLDVDAREPSVVRIKQFFYPSWRARVDDGTSTPNELKVAATPGSALLTVAVPAGKNSVDVVLQPLPEERYGLALSGVGLLGVLLLVGWRRRKPVASTTRRQRSC